MFFFVFIAWIHHCSSHILLSSPLALAFTTTLHFLSFLLSSYWCPVFWLCNSYFWVCRLNNLKRASADTLEGNKSVTYMDLRDNQMTDLDLSSLGSLEQLHCERNKLKELTLSGFSLRALYANSNCMSLCLLHLPSSTHTWNIYPGVTVVRLYVMCLLRLAPRDHICMDVGKLCNRRKGVVSSSCPKNLYFSEICLGVQKKIWFFLVLVPHVADEEVGYWDALVPYGR